VKGVEPSAYPNAVRQPGLGGSRIIPAAPAAGSPLIEAHAPMVPSSQPAFSGGATPEPEQLAGLALIALLLLWRLRRLSRTAA
jgi:MYXO-CTERM domain-containing protein